MQTAASAPRQGAADDVEPSTRGPRMLTAFLRAFRTPDLRRKLLFTIFIIAMFRLGSNLPTPGISEKAVNACLNLSNANSGQAGMFQLVNLFSVCALRLFA